MPVPRLRPYNGPVLLSYGFRPFFLFGSIYSGLAILAFLPAFYGELELSSLFSPRDWHVHEMLYGYLPAVITGFLLTAVPNWTGRLPLQGKELLILVLIWIVGRFAVTASAWIGASIAAVLDLAFLLTMVAAVAREIIAGRNWRNLKVLIPLSVLFAGNLVFHVEAHVYGTAEYGVRFGVAAVLMLIILIGGRIVPSFTRHWLVRENPGRLPASFKKFDVMSIIVAAGAVIVWCVAPDWSGTGVALMLAGLLQAGRLGRWAGDRTWAEPLIFVMHVAYAFVPIGFVLLAIASFGFAPSGAGIHAWTGGAFGGMTLAIMSRASLGHTGRALVATRPTQIVYGLVFAAAIARIFAALNLNGESATLLLHVAAIAWAAAFLGFAGYYWPVFTRPRVTA